MVTKKTVFAVFAAALGITVGVGAQAATAVIGVSPIARAACRSDSFCGLVYCHATSCQCCYISGGTHECRQIICNGTVLSAVGVEETSELTK